MELNNNLYVAFSFNHLKFSKIVHDTYMTIYVYNKDDGSFQVMYDVTYDQLKRANQVKNVDGKPISLIAYRYGSGMFHPEHNSIIWDNISYILKAIDNIIIYGKYNILGKDDVRIESQDLHVKYLGENPTVISNHRSLLLSMIDKVYVYETYLIGFNTYMLHDLYRMYETIPHVTDLDNNKTEHLRKFVTYALDDIPCFENQSLGNIHEYIWKSYISKVNGNRSTLDFWKTYYDNNPDDVTLSQKIVIDQYDDDEETFHKNVDDLVDEVNSEYSTMKNQLKNNSRKLKKISSGISLPEDGSPSTH